MDGCMHDPSVSGSDNGWQRQHNSAIAVGAAPTVAAGEHLAHPFFLTSFIDLFVLLCISYIYVHILFQSIELAKR